MSCYLKIMKMQYHDLFNYEIEMDESIANILFPKMVLQPIAENSLYHGLQMKRRIFEEHGFIRIRTLRTETNTITIEIQDNGEGIAPDTLKELRQGMDTSCYHSPSGFGLKNINQRIKLYYGDCYGLEIDSVFHIETIVRITVPLIFYCDN